MARLLLPFLIGIAWAINTSPHQSWAVYAVLLGVVILIPLLFSKLNTRIRWQPIIGLVATVTLFIAGLAQVHFKTHPHHTAHYSHVVDSTQYWIATLSHPPVERKKSYRLELQLTAAFQQDTSVPVFGKVYAYLPKDSLVQSLNYGTRLQLEQRFRPIDPPANPHEFNYKRYLTFKNIYHQGYFPDGSWQVVDHSGGNPVLAKVFQMRKYLLGVIQNNLSDSTSMAVASALLVGHKDWLDKETLTAYASTGAMHVLAVSGLHVGIIYLVLQRLFNFLLLRFKRGQWISAGLQLAGIWLFALITGLSPSVIRAATMFTFVIIGTNLKRPVHVYNSIAASAFLLLAFNPYLLTEIGFLLSYAAVLSIVYFQPKFYRLVYIPNKALDWVWQITCVSIAAQLGTFVIGILFFHQFPTYFLFSNLIVIPAAIGILHVGLVLFLVSPIPILANAVGWVLNEGIHWLNYCIHWLESWPHALIQPLTISLPQGVFLYVVLLGMSAWLVHRYRWGVAITTVAVVLFMSSFTFDRITESQSAGLTVYAVRGHTAINLHRGNTAWLLADSSLIHDEDKMLFHIRHHSWYAGWRSWYKQEKEQLPIAGMQCQQVAWWQAPPASIPTDTITTLVLSKNRNITPAHVQSLSHLDKLVLDGSHSRGSIRFWRSIAAENGWSIHAVLEDGAYVVEW